MKPPQSDDIQISIGDELNQSEVFVLDAFDSLIEEMREAKRNAFEYHGEEFARMFAIAITNLQTAKMWAREAYETM